MAAAGIKLKPLALSVVLIVCKNRCFRFYRQGNKNITHFIPVAVVLNFQNIAVIYKHLLRQKMRKNKKPPDFIIKSSGSVGADNGSRTRLSSLGSWRSTDELYLHGFSIAYP